MLLPEACTDVQILIYNTPAVFAPHSLPLSLSLSQEQEFLQKQQQELDGALKKIIQQHKLEIATIERDCLNHKQQLMRGQRDYLKKFTY